MTYDPVPEPSPWARFAKLATTIAIIVVAVIAVVGGASYLGRTIGDSIASDDTAGGPSNVTPGIAVTVEIPPGSTARDIGAILAGQGVVRSSLEFESAVRETDSASSLKAGVYEFETLMDPSEVVAMIVVGPVAEIYRLTVIEGLRVPEILQALTDASGRAYESFESALLDGEVSSSLLPDTDEVTLESWEGLLFPDTYEFRRSSTPAEILQRMATTMEQHVASVDWSALTDLGLTEYDGIVLASLIESEALLEEERPIISSVIHNRLEMGMKLDIDATVLYALDTRDVTRFDNTIDSPYNTYLVAGLPPTPIAAPRLTSLQAAANPDDTPYLFYVLSDLEGHHAFAETLEEHNRNVDQAREDGVLG
jgi:UPF0755 protein